MSTDHTPRTIGLYLLAVLPVLVVICFRLAGPTDLDNNDQAKQALYALDIYQNGNWVLPQERGTVAATKPPLYAWLAAGTAWITGGITEWSCRLPSVLAALLLTLLVFQLGYERWDARVGLVAAWILACSHTVIDLAIHVRPDMILALLVGLSIFALHRAEFGRPQFAGALFWCGFSLSILAKGPIGPLLLLPPLAVLCSSLERRGRVLQMLRSRWAWTLALPLTWATLAYLVGGSDYVTETVLPETVDRVLAVGSRSTQGVPLGYLVAHFMAKFLPWSLFAGIAFVRVLSPRLRARDPALLLPVSLFAGGLLLLNLSRGQRQDYLLPLLPAAALGAAAVMVNGPAWIRSLWRVVAGLSAALALIAGIAAWTGIPSDPATLDGLGRAWASAFIAAGTALTFFCFLGRLEALSIRGMLGSILALLVVHAGYNAALSPVARASRGEDLRRFALATAARRQPGEYVRISQGVSNAVYFLMGQNDAPLTVREIEAYDRWTPSSGRALLVCRIREQRTLEKRWPGRFRPLVWTSVGTDGEGLTLLEDMAGHSAVRHQGVGAQPGMG